MLISCEVVNLGLKSVDDGRGGLRRFWGWLLVEKMEVFFYWLFEMGLSSICLGCSMVLCFWDLSS